MTTYLLTDVDNIKYLLGAETSVEFTKISGRLKRTLMIKRVGKSDVDILVNDYDGSRLILRACLNNGFATLICPFLYGSEYEKLVLNLIWSYVTEKFEDLH